MNRKCYSNNSYSSENIIVRVFSDLNRIHFNKILLSLLFFGISYSGISQNNTDSLKSNINSGFYQQSEPLNVFYDATNDKFVIENNTKQFHNFNFGIYNITGTPIKEYQLECLNGKSSEIPIELNAGIYIVNITDKSYTYTKKFIIR